MTGSSSSSPTASTSSDRPGNSCQRFPGAACRRRTTSTCRRPRAPASRRPRCAARRARGRARTGAWSRSRSRRSWRAGPVQPVVESPSVRHDLRTRARQHVPPELAQFGRDVRHPLERRERCEVARGGPGADVDDAQGIPVRTLVELPEELLADPAECDREADPFEGPGVGRVAGPVPPYLDGVQFRGAEGAPGSQPVHEGADDLVGPTLDPGGPRHEVDAAAVRRHEVRIGPIILPEALVRRAWRPSFSIQWSVPSPPSLTQYSQPRSMNSSSTGWISAISRVARTMPSSPTQDANRFGPRDRFFLEFRFVRTPIFMASPTRRNTAKSVGKPSLGPR